jgi:AcrR family transcriptional regulator
MTVAATTDGRRARSERSRAAIVDAFLELLPNATRRPTVEEIAAAAGVSERSVYRHFPDVDSLVRAAIDRRVERMAPLAELRADPNAPLDVRIATLARQRVRFYEAALPLRRFTDQAEEELPMLVELGRARREFLRAQLVELFVPELSASDGDGPLLADALEAVASWSTWHHLRAEQALTVDEAELVLCRMVTSLLRPSCS